jgi:hypothetical protein
MDENEISTEKKTPISSHVKTAAEVVVITYTAITAAKGLYDLGKDLKSSLKEKRQAKKDQTEK